MNTLKSGKELCYFTIVFTIAFFSLTCSVCNIAVAGNSLPIFPGAVGFGTYTRAAYGLSPQINPTVYKVTSLSPSTTTPGTLGYALYQTGPRIIVFEVSGTIDGPAGGVYQYWVDNPYLTVAGQTAPSPGITLKGIKLVLRTHDVLIQHVRIRLGDMIDPSISQYDLDTWATNASNFLANRDCISIGNYANKDAYNVVIDHCSFSWSMDENIEIFKNSGGELNNITVSNSISSEGLLHNVRCLYDPAYTRHSKGLLVASYRSPTNISIIGNLLAHNQDRNPVVADGSSVVANNLVYNPENWGPNTYANYAPEKTSFVGNVVISGPNSLEWVKAPFSVASHAWKPWYNNGIGSEVYAYDNVCESCGSDPWDGVHDSGGLENTIRVNQPPIWPVGFSARSGSEVQKFVLNNAGARPADRDSVDQRICDDISARTGKFIDSQNDVGGWPTLLNNSRTLILPNNPHGDDDNDGYTILEEWLHEYSEQLEFEHLKAIKAPEELHITIAS